MPTQRINPSDYNISPHYGFLPSPPPLSSFPNPYYKPWDDLLHNLPSLIQTTKLVKAIDQLPHLETTQLCTTQEKQRAYVLLAFLVHALVWHKPTPIETIPPQLSEPFLQICEQLGLQPVVSYAGLCTWDWRIRNGGAFDLENLEVLASFTGTRSEAAFYLVPVLVEYAGGPLVCKLLNALYAAEEGEKDVVVDVLRETAKGIERMGEQLMKVFGSVDARFFYHQHRPFLAGGAGMEMKGLPRGMVFQRSDGSEVPCKLVGGSAVQSSLFPFLDYAFGVKHMDAMFAEMRAYMPAVQRDFLDQVSRIPSLREYVEANLDDAELRGLFDECLEKLRAWRGKHIAVVSKYIVQPAREAEKGAVVETIEVEASDEAESGLQGTGGAALIPFLRQARDDTTSAAK